MSNASVKGVCKMKSLKFINLLFISWMLIVLFPSQGFANTASGGPGLFQTTLFADQNLNVGSTSVWNSPKKMLIQLETTDNWLISEVQIYVGYPGRSHTSNEKRCTGARQVPLQKGI